MAYVIDAFYRSAAGFVRDQYRLINIYEAGKATPMFDKNDYQ
jgi:hypothetical protein